MGEIKDLARQVRRLGDRVEKLEGRLEGSGGKGPSNQPSELPCCSLPIVPPRQFGPNVSDHRERLLRYLGRKWVNGTKLRFAFFNSGEWTGPESERNLVREGFDVWSDVGIGIEFEEVSAISEAEVRVGFLQNGRTWSYVGRDVIDIPGQNERTMNFGWRIATDSRGVDVPVHEIGHTLGFPHEHQNPFAGIVWDDDAVYDYFAQQGWTRADTDHNVLRKLPAQEVEGSDWDPDSIMHYGFPSGLILQPSEYRGGISPTLGLTDVDRDRVRTFYPARDGDRLRVLEPFRLQSLELGPGEQADFAIDAQWTREYTLQTFGQADTLLVLFEEVDGELRYADGDDDSGTSTNARIRMRLHPGRRYVLRVLLYYAWASDETAVMMW